MHPILLNLGSINIYSFGVFLVLALIMGLFFTWREARNKLDEELIFDASVTVVFLALVAGRLTYIFSHFTNFNFDLLRWLHIYLYPGFSFWGAVSGGLLGAVLFASRQKVSFWFLADYLALGTSLGQIFGQVGCFLNDCVIGKETNLPWGLSTIGFIGKRHPVALYDLIAALIIFLVLLRLYRWTFSQKNGKAGALILMYLTLLILSSLLLEFYRESELYFYNLSLNQLIALAFLVPTGIIWYVRLDKSVSDILLLSSRFIKHKALLILKIKQRGGQK